jgi:hypothetical protein
MLHRNDGKNIAILFFARARTAVKCASGVVFVVVLCSTGLTSTSPAPKQRSQT